MEKGWEVRVALSFYIPFMVVHVTLCERSVLLV